MVTMSKGEEVVSRQREEHVQSKGLSSYLQNCLTLGLCT